MSLEKVFKLVRDVPNFPVAGVTFKDITPLMAEPGALNWVCEQLVKPFLDKGITKVLAIESRGFFFFFLIAEKLNAGLVPIRKAGKLPWETIQQSYTLEYGESTIEMHRDAVGAEDRVLIVDDVLATGGTLKAAQTLASELGATVVGATVFLELGFLSARKTLELKNIHALWTL